MEVTEVINMIFETLRTMVIGITGVFAVLAVFYCTLKLLMLNKKRSNINIIEDEET